MENKMNNLRMEAAKELSKSTGKTIEEALRTLSQMDKLTRSYEANKEVAVTE